MKGFTATSKHCRCSPITAEDSVPQAKSIDWLISNVSNQLAKYVTNREGPTY
jgi:hypothetical protein